MSKASDRKQIRKWLDAADRQGFRVEPTKKGWMVYPQDRNLPGVLIHGTPSDSRALPNIRALLRRIGVKTE